jgi:thioesterase domain-containing protein
VAQVAGAVLGVSSVGIHDSLPELGMGKSEARSLSHELVSLLGRRATVASLLDAATVEGIAGIYRELPRVARWSSLVALNPGAVGPSLICVHPLGGNAFWYLPLARKLGNALTVYGLHSRGLDPAEKIESDTVMMARSYVDDLKRRAPRGPYALLGWSFGGILAFAMARRLAEMDTVSLVAVLDVGPVDAPTLPDSADAAYGLLVHAVSLDHMVAQLMGLPGEERLDEMYRACLALNRLPPGYTREHLARMLAINQSNLRAMKSYEFGRYSGEFTIFRATERDHNPHIGHDEDLGWGRYVTKIRIHPIAGKHYDAMNRINVNVIADHLSRALTGVERS